jgi:hypothetical protein
MTSTAFFLMSAHAFSPSLSKNFKINFFITEN